jgi:hypothetical protein
MTRSPNPIPILLRHLATSLLLTASLGLQAQQENGETRAGPAAGQMIPAPPAGAPSTRLQGEIRDLKKQVLQLNKDLFLLEEDLLFPANTQFSVFLSLDAGQLFGLDAAQLKIDDKIVANHLYTDRELSALKRGGVQRLYIGNLPSGEHEIVAIFVGKGPNGRDFRRGETLKIEKGEDPLFVELRIADDPTKEQPAFSSRGWE